MQEGSLDSRRDDLNKQQNPLSRRVVELESFAFDRREQAEAVRGDGRGCVTNDVTNTADVFSFSNT